MLLLFCGDPLNSRQPDPAFEAEVTAAQRLGVETALIQFEALVNDGDPERAVRRVPEQEVARVALYRGWMVSPEQYRQLYQALAARGVRLINDPAAYRHCHYLPESYAAIEGQTPRSVWFTFSGDDLPLDRIMELLRPFGSTPVIVKDFVKSRKHEWHEACFIPSASERSAVERVVRRFLALQGEDLNEGLVFREFVEFEPLARHSRSGMPLTKEFRIFVLDGRPIFYTPYWDEGNYAGEAPPIERFAAAAREVKSRFFTMDVAERRDGGWMIVELGDGQVAGLPENADLNAFYRSLTNAVQLPAGSQSRSA